ncbi:TOBE domain-containing protein [Frankia sp. CNm7]|uniref:TOBE domain-containing protein n=1 Tax=Frankia nepalensis TaxID=1836974 RepID=A0A937R9P1_9ACTN|nr:TOBE domain-containing protein [Frankia nepalensis]MBL7501444.1 TOBE domain-containing protein [Frankia nepalensis]MBL7509993.1 TOBE domain-containing protein [Frankia nepalensis]MBL7517157.1 TOBE domain-containing protein [Frankia nepalensis]MBL7627996.1 TOBE domain-containing protein [Frankia nepalensis]
MTVSIRNQLAGRVTEVASGQAMGTVKVRLTSGRDMTAAVTMDAIRDLGVAAGSDVHVLVKSTGVALATSAVPGVSIRNQLPGTVTAVDQGGAMAAVHVAVDGGQLTAAITQAAVSDLGLTTGTPVTALIKSTEVSLETL